MDSQAALVRHMVPLGPSSASVWLAVGGELEGRGAGGGQAKITIGMVHH
jgi:hypothetical protein